MTLPSLFFRAIGRTTDTRRSTPQSIGQRQRHSTSYISNLWENQGLFHIIASTKDRSILADTWDKSRLTSSLQNLLANSKTWLIRKNVWNFRLFFRYSYSTLKLFIMVSGRHLLVDDHRRQEWHSRKASSCHRPSQQLSTQAFNVVVWIEAKNSEILGVDRSWTSQPMTYSLDYINYMVIERLQNKVWTSRKLQRDFRTTLQSYRTSG